MANSVVSLAEPFFLKVLTIVNQNRNSEMAQLEDLQRRLKMDLQAIEHKVTSGAVSLSAGEWQSLKRMLIYWADEVLTAQIPDWQNYVLEHDYFEERNRAWKFYVEAENVIPTGSPATAELFYLAVVLGFVGDLEGAFRHELGQELPGGKSDPAEARRHWATQLQRQIQNVPATPLQGEPLDGDSEPVSGQGAYRASIATCTVCSLAFVITLCWWLFRTT